MRYVLSALLLVLTAAGASARPVGDLIPREVLFGNPERAAPRLSPDGKQLAYFAPVDGVLNVWVGPVGNPDAAKPVTHDTNRGIMDFSWAFTSKHIIYTQDKNGDENHRVYRVDLATGETLDLTPFEGVQARIQEGSRFFPNHMLVALNNRIPMLHDIYRVNIKTGQLTLVYENPGLVAVMTDDLFRLRLGFTFSPMGGLQLLKFGEDGQLEPLMSVGPEDVMTTGPVGFDRSGEVLYAIDSRGRNTAALVSLDLNTLETKVIAEDPRVDMGAVLVHPIRKIPQAYATEYERREWHPIDPAVAGDLAYLRTVADGEFGISSRSLDDSVWTVAYTVDTGPVRYYLYDRKAKKAKFLFTHRPDLERYKLAPMHPVVIKSRDGLDLVSYLTLPLSSDPDGDERPARPLPLVLWVHGGPWTRDSWGFNPIHQWLADRGYAVMSVNYRGSTGFGKAFINAANLEWGRKMHDDLLDAVAWAIAEGIADPAKVAITGGSYGGYATLVGMTMTPDVFACGVDLVGPSNLVTWLNNVPEYWIPIMPLLKDRVGDHTTPEGQAFLMERSPITYVSNIAKPLLIGQGANDPRVPQRESEQIVAAMQAHGIPVTYVVYPEEGHGFQKPENSLSYWAIKEAFLAQHLGGRAEPFGDAFVGANLEVRAGAEEIRGLAEALAK